MYPTVVGNLRSTIIAHIGMFHKLSCTKAVYLQLLHLTSIRHLHPGKGIGRKILYLQELVGRRKSAKTPPVLDDSAGKIRTYTGNTAKQGTVGKVYVYSFITRKFLYLNRFWS